MSAPRIYLDHAATTALRPEARRAIEAVWDDAPGNAASSHGEGRAAARQLAQARAEVAALTGARPEEVFFTAGATEASNLAIRGSAQARAARGRRIVATRLEHPATQRACEVLAMEGWRVTLLRPDAIGLIDADELAYALKPDTTVVSVIAGHNELGTLEPLEALAEAAHAGQALIHFDAVQAVGYVPIGEVPWDLVSISAHKIGGPQGIGALVVRGPQRPRAVLVGGGQEDGVRPGTVAVALAAGFGAAATAVCATRAAEAGRIAVLRDRLAAGIRAGCAELVTVGTSWHRAEQALPQILTFGIDGVRGDELIHALDAHGVAASSSSACAGDARSHVLDAIGLAESIGLVRLSLGWNTDRAMIDAAIERTADAIAKVREKPPFERRRPIVAAHARRAGVAMTTAHWETAEAIFEFHRREGVLPGARYLGRVLGSANRAESLFPEGLSTVAKWLGIPLPQGGCHPGGV